MKTNKKNSFIVSAQWFDNNRDCYAGLNRSQAQAIGEAYPLKKGWRERILGKEITLEQKESFEAAKGLVYRVKKELIKSKRSSKIFSAQKESLTLEVEVAKLRLELNEVKKKLLG